MDWASSGVKVLSKAAISTYTRYLPRASPASKAWSRSSRLAPWHRTFRHPADSSSTWLRMRWHWVSFPPATVKVRVAPGALTTSSSNSSSTTSS